MKERFEIKFLEAASVFVETIDEKASDKFFANIERAKHFNDPKIFKKIDLYFWEFRVKSMRMQYRLLAFWDKRNNTNTLVVCTHGFIKKTDKIPRKEITRAYFIMNEYLKKYE